MSSFGIQVFGDYSEFNSEKRASFILAEIEVGNTAGSFTFSKLSDTYDSVTAFFIWTNMPQGANFYSPNVVVSGATIKWSYDLPMSGLTNQTAPSGSKGVIICITY